MLDMPGSARANDPDAAGRPQPSQGPAPRFGGGRVTGVLHALDIPYAALTLGASIRGPHDSRVSHFGNEQPRMLLRPHEDHAAVMARDWAKVTDPPMAAAPYDTPAQATDAVLAGTVAVRVVPGCGADLQAPPAKEAKPDRG